MGKYIWPRDIGNATRWYLGVLKEIKRGASLDELLELIASDQIRQNKPTRDQLSRQINRLNKIGLVNKTGHGASAKYTINDHGLRRLEAMNFKQISQPEVWDKKWRLVIFDIPENCREARDQIRRLLKELGFVQLQLSVWIHPFAALGEFKQIQKAYGLAEHIQLLQAVEYSPSANVKRHFTRLYSKLMK